jgi:hypothetical protein
MKKVAGDSYGGLRGRLPLTRKINATILLELSFDGMFPSPTLVGEG